MKTSRDNVKNISLKRLYAIKNDNYCGKKYDYDEKAIDDAINIKLQNKADKSILEDYKAFYKLTLEQAEKLRYSLYYEWCIYNDVIPF